MTDRDTNPERDPTLPLPNANGVGGTLPVPAVPDRDDEVPRSGLLDEERDVEPAEGDDAVISGSSPEFQHLTKPKRAGGE